MKAKRSKTLYSVSVDGVELIKTSGKQAVLKFIINDCSEYGLCIEKLNRK